MTFKELIPTRSTFLALLGITASSSNAALISVSSYVYDGTGPGSAPHPSFLDTGTSELTNSTLPASTAFADPQWVGYQDGGGSGTPATSDHPQITFDFGSQQTVGTVEIVYLHSTVQASGTITAPDSVIITVSDDNSTYSAPTTFTAEFDSSPGDAIRVASLDVSALPDAQFYRLEFRQSSQWTFLAEVSFDGAPVPEPSTGILALLGVFGLARRRRA